MNTLSIKQIDAFTTVPHTGNPAGVVLDGKQLNDQQMQAIAREINASETAFILPATQGEADLRIRWFTPATEVPICGHATIASFHALAEEGMLGMKTDGSYHFRVETVSGILPVDIVKQRSDVLIMLGVKIPTFERVTHFKLDLVRILNITLSDFDNRLTIMRGDFLYVPVRRLHSLFSMKPNFLAMANFLATRNFGGMCVYTTETIERESVVHSRFFAPHQGVNEDPVTGATHGPLSVFLFEGGLIQVQEGGTVLQGEQGDAIGRRGRVRIHLEVSGKKAESVKIGGHAVTVLKGQMMIGQ